MGDAVARAFKTVTAVQEQKRHRLIAFNLLSTYHFGYFCCNDWWAELELD